MSVSAADVVEHRTPASRPVVVMPRLVWLDSAKGIGILLVVLGHSLGGLYDGGLVKAGSALWLLFYGVYVFHMPLFFFLSASLIYGRVVANPRRVLSSSLTKIAWPYFVWATVQIVVLIEASGAINHAQTRGFGASVIRLLWAPHAQFWFLYVLFFLHMTVLVAGRIGGKLLFGFVMASVYAACMLSSAVSGFVTFYVGLVSLLFYTLGVCFGDVLLKANWPIRRPLPLLAICGLIWFGAAWAVWATQADFYAPGALPAAFAGTAAVIIIARSLRDRPAAILSYLGRRAMTIYVMHVLFVAGSRILLVQHLHVENPVAILPIICIVGVLGPLAAYAILGRLRLRSALGLS